MCSRSWESVGGELRGQQPTAMTMSDRQLSIKGRTVHKGGLTVVPANTQRYRRVRGEFRGRAVDGVLIVSAKSPTYDHLQLAGIWFGPFANDQVGSLEAYPSFR